MKSGIFLAICIIFFYGCFGSKAPQGQTDMPRKATWFDNNGLTLKTVTSKDSVLSPGDTLFNYKFTVSVVTTEIVTFDSVWIGQKPLDVSISKEKNSLTSGELKVPLGSTITLQATDFHAAQMPSNSRSPVPYKGVGLIRYLLSGKAYYLVIKEIKPVVPKKSIFD